MRRSKEMLPSGKSVLMYARVNFRLLVTLLLFIVFHRDGVSGTGVVYPPEDVADTRTKLVVGLVQSYDPSARDERLGAIGTVVGTELALDHINADDSILPGYRLHYNFINSQVRAFPAAALLF